MRPLVPSLEGRRLATRYSRQSLSAQISLNHRSVSRLERQLELQLLSLVNLLSEDIAGQLKSLQERVIAAETTKCKLRQKSKFDRLLSSSYSQKDWPGVQERWVVNLSKTPLHRSETEVLKKGLNFAPTPSRIPVSQIIASVERGLSKVPEDVATMTRKRIACVLSRSKPPPSNLPPTLRSALRSLSKREDILILPADKGRATVVLEKTEYDEKMLEMLSDEKIYKKLGKDPTPSMERKLNALLLQLKKKGSIPAGLYHQIRSSGGLTPLLYGLPKVHKPGVPLRPIVSFYSSPSYQLSKHLSMILAPLIGNSVSHVHNSAEFTSFIVSQTLNPDEILVSFDVVSLFTNVPVNLAIDVAQQRLLADDTLELRTNLSVLELIRLLEFCLNATYMTFRGQVFQQTYGTAMGSPVSVSVANIVMEDVEERALASYEIQLPFWKRYVDDICTAVPKQRVQHLLQHLNGIEQSIQFTVELESEGCLPFLDVHMCHSPDGSISTSVHRKETHTDKYLAYSSHHPLSHKIAVIRTLCTRADTHSSTAVSVSQEVDHVVTALQANGYPKAMVHHYSTRSSSETRRPSPRWRSTTVLPYVQGLSESLRRILSPLEIRVCFRPHRTIRQLLSRPKDLVPDLQRSGVVYSIPCASCPAKYIGQTGRRLCQRLDEHKRAVKGADFNSSALAEHAWSKGHPVDWTNTKVLSSCPEYHSRLVEEAIRIRTTDSVLNRDIGSLPSVYDNLLHKV